MKNQAFGVEIELTGIERKRAAEVIADYFRTTEEHERGSYDPYEIKDQMRRTWKVMRDGSISPQRKFNGGVRAAGDEYRTEVVTPICNYEDIEKIQDIVRLLKAAGAIANKSCGIHVHIDASNHNEKTLRNLVNIFYSKQDLIYKALDVNKDRENSYCRKLNEGFVNEINTIKPKDMNDLANIWYRPYSGSRNIHYHDSRYHALNLHATFTKGTVEFRLFNGTTHAGKIKAYIQFCLAISNQALTQKSASSKKTETTNDKYTFRTWLLRLGLIGDEYKTCRTHLLANLEGDTAFRNRIAA